MQPLYEGLVACSQNHWPSLSTDLGRINDLISPLLPAGFYYKTFMRPAKAWTAFYEKLIRRIGGMGAAPVGRDPDRYGHRFAHCDVLIVGAGPAGIAAAAAAANEGADVLLVDEREVAGGSAYADRRTIDSKPALDWVGAQLSALQAKSNVRVMLRTTAFGAYDHHWVALVERVLEHHNELGNADLPRQRRWLVKAARIVLATGAAERPLVFSGNDLPSVMLASATRRYINEFGVLPGRKAVVFTNNPDAYRTAFDLIDAGADVRAVVDAREDVEIEFRDRLREHGVTLLPGHAVIQARGAPQLRVVEIRAIDAQERPAKRVTAVVDCDLLCMSGGFSPSLHLHSQRGGKIRYDPALAAFIPVATDKSVSVVGAASGACDSDLPWSIRPLWRVLGGEGKQFVDFQDDVTVGDLLVALRENYSSVEHIKRYTTLGMGTDQGKTSNMNGLAIVASETGRPIPEVGTTTFRPPYTPVALGVLAGTHAHGHLDPVRRSPLHEWHQRSGAAWMPAGLWMRPRAYPRNGERLEQAIRREVHAVRQAVGLCDMSTLGKIDVQGPDAAAFLSRVYCNAVEKVPIGRCRYGCATMESCSMMARWHAWARSTTT
jgi:sarcosine oxidase subunit alpha